MVTRSTYAGKICRGCFDYPAMRRINQFVITSVIYGVVPLELRGEALHTAIKLILWLKHPYSFARFSLKALLITDTELRLMAAAAIIGDSSRPNTGYKIPAAIGTPSAL